MVQGSISRVGMWGSRSSQSCSGGADDLRSAVRAPPSHPSLKSVRQLNRRVLHTGSPPSPQPHLRRRTREWCRALAGRGPVGRPGVAISGRSPHFWTEKYPGRTLRSKSCRISRKSTRPQARSRTRFLYKLRGGSGGPHEAWTPSRLIGLVLVHASRLVQVAAKPWTGFPGRVRHPLVQELRWDGRRLLPYGQATRTEAISATED